MSAFDQADYWRRRHEELEGDPRSVGNRGRTIEENLAGEAAIQQVVQEAALRLQPARTVLDLGCGYGRVSRSFTDLGYRYTGVDVSDVAVRQAAARNPEATFLIGDLAEWSTSETFDVVLVLYVFVHFVDDDAWRDFVDRSLSWVTPGGALLFADSFPTERQAPGAHVVARPLDWYVSAFDTSGFVLDDDFHSQLINAVGPPARPFHLARRVA